jgi:hypothetical protein
MDEEPQEPAEQEPEATTAVALPVSEAWSSGEDDDEPPDAAA